MEVKTHRVQFMSLMAAENSFLKRMGMPSMRSCDWSVMGSSGRRSPGRGGVRWSRERVACRMSVLECPVRVYERVCELYELVQLVE